MDHLRLQLDPQAHRPGMLNRVECGSCPYRLNVQFAFAVKRFKLTDVDLKKSMTSLSTQTTRNR